MATAVLAELLERIAPRSARVGAGGRADIGVLRRGDVAGWRVVIIRSMRAATSPDMASIAAARRWRRQNKKAAVTPAARAESQRIRSVSVLRIADRITPASLRRGSFAEARGRFSELHVRLNEQPVLLRLAAAACSAPARW